MRDATSEAGTLPEFMTVREVADLLRVSRASLDRWIRSGNFVAPISLGGATVRFARAEVLQFIAKHQTAAPALARQRKSTRRERASPPAKRARILPRAKS